MFKKSLTTKMKLFQAHTQYKKRFKYESSLFSVKTYIRCTNPIKLKKTIIDDYKFSNVHDLAIYCKKYKKEFQFYKSTQIKLQEYWMYIKYKQLKREEKYIEEIMNFDIDLKSSTYRYIQYLFQ